MDNEIQLSQVQPRCEPRPAKTVSVAMATYNGERFLQQQLDSLLRQTYAPTELVVLDDCSTDSTLNILFAFQTSAPFRVVVEQNSSRLNYRANFMRCISMCTCEVIAFCDQDDIWNARKLSDSVNALGSPDTTLFFHDSLFIDENNNPMGLSHINQLPKVNRPGSFYPLNSPFGYSIAFRRQLLQFSSLWDKSLDTNDRGERMAHDQWIFFIASILGTIICSPIPLVSYRQHGGNLYGWKKKYSCQKHLKDLLTNRGVQYLHFSDVCGRRSEIAAEIAELVSGNQRTLAEQARIDYLKLSQLWRMRADIFTSRSILTRLKAPYILMCNQGYQEHPWAFGSKNFFKDLFLSLVHPFLFSWEASD